MTFLFVVVGIAVIAAAGMAAAGGLGQLPRVDADRRPEGAEPAFDVVFRGYRMDEVDEAIDALKARIAALEAGRG